MVQTVGLKPASVGSSNSGAIYCIDREIIPVKFVQEIGPLLSKLSLWYFFIDRSVVLISTHEPNSMHINIQPVNV